jgi:hypothetical protein
MNQPVSAVIVIKTFTSGTDGELESIFHMETFHFDFMAIRSLCFKRGKAASIAISGANVPAMFTSAGTTTI